MKKIFLITSLILIIIIIGFWFFHKMSPAITPQATSDAKIEKMIQENSSNQSSNIPALTYIGARDALQSGTDSLFSNPLGPNPEIKIRLANLNDKKLINTKRAELNKLLQDWAKLIAEPGSLSNSSLQSLSEENRKIVLDYLNDLSAAISGLSPEDSGLTQTQIDGYKKIVDDAQTKVLTLDQSKIKTDNYSAPARIIDTSGKPKLIEGINRN